MRCLLPYLAGIAIMVLGACSSSPRLKVLTPPPAPAEFALPDMAESEGTFPRALLWLDPSGTVNRTAIKYDNGNALHWTIVLNGKVVLKRNARNETQYHYFSGEPGIYTIYLEQFVDGAYRVISNVVSYRME